MTKQKTIPPQQRRRLLALIHVGKKQLGLDDEDYRNLLVGVTKKDSAADMDVSELNQVIAAMEQMGFTVTPSKSKEKLSPKTRHKKSIDHTQADKIRALWIECYNAGAIRNRGDDSLQRFIKTTCKVDRIEWLTYDQASRLIMILNNKLEKANGPDDSSL